MNKEKVNTKSIITALVVTLAGILMVLADLFLLKTATNVWISIGCSLIASGMVIGLTAWLVERKESSELEKWGLEKIYYTRSEQNTDTEPQLEKAKYKVDAVVFGLKSFRDKHGHIVERCLSKGVNFRILTMDPNGDYIAQREKEENVSEGSIKDTIEKLVSWADELNAQNRKGHIEIRGYSCMTLDFYWRVDDSVCIGPYWYGTDSQQTITYKFRDDEKNGLGFKQYAQYFDKLWNDKELSTLLTKPLLIKDKKVKKNR